MDSLFQYLKGHFPASANGDQYPEATYKSAGLLIPQMQQLAHRSSAHRMKVRKVGEFQDNDANSLLELLEKNGSDKGNRHHYFYVYFYILSLLGVRNKLRIFEIGLGTNNPSLISTMGAKGVPGASIRAFRDFLPNADVFGADIDKDILFSEDRIQTAYVDQLERSSFEELPFLGEPFDLIIDDGLHSIGANINSLLFAIDQIRPGGWVVIEDIPPQNSAIWEAVDLFVKIEGGFDTCFVKCRKSCLYVLHKHPECMI